MMMKVVWKQAKLLFILVANTTNYLRISFTESNPKENRIKNKRCSTRIMYVIIFFYQIYSNNDWLLLSTQCRTISISWNDSTNSWYSCKLSFCPFSWFIYSYYQNLAFNWYGSAISSYHIPNVSLINNDHFVDSWSSVFRLQRTTDDWTNL